MTTREARPLGWHIICRQAPCVPPHSAVPGTAIQGENPMSAPLRVRRAAPPPFLLGRWLAGLVAPDPLNAAYIDPLSGSVILQVLAAGVFSMVFTMKRTWRWLGSRLGSIRNRLLRQ